MQLYKIDAALMNLVENADPVTGEIDGEALASLTLAKEEKQLHVAQFIRHLDNELEVIDKEISRLQSMKKTSEARQEWLRNYLKKFMDIDGRTELNFTTFKAKIKENPGAVVIDDEDLIPEEYKSSKTVVSISKATLKIPLTAGESIPGCHLEKTTRLEIK